MSNIIMNLNEYQDKAMSTCMSTSENPVYMCGGLCEETGELWGKITKAVRKGYISIENNQIVSHVSGDEYSDWLLGVVKELGDVLWMVAGIAYTLNVSLDFVARENIEKLAARKKNGTIAGQGDGVSKEERLNER